MMESATDTFHLGGGSLEEGDANEKHECDGVRWTGFLGTLGACCIPCKHRFMVFIE